MGLPGFLVSIATIQYRTSDLYQTDYEMTGYEGSVYTLHFTIKSTESGSDLHHVAIMALDQDRIADGIFVFLEKHSKFRLHSYFLI